MGHCSLGKSVPLGWTVGWDTGAWVRVSFLAGLLGGTLEPGSECPLRLDCSVGHWRLGKSVHLSLVGHWSLA